MNIPFKPISSVPLSKADFVSKQTVRWCPGCGDGFDVNSDGIIESQEAYTNAEEYSYGAPSSWVTEIDGLRCFGTMGNLVETACSDIDRGIKNLNSGWLA